MPRETTVLRAFALGESRATWLLTQEKIHTIIGNISRDFIFFIKTIFAGCS